MACDDRGNSSGVGVRSRRWGYALQAVPMVGLAILRWRGAVYDLSILCGVLLSPKRFWGIRSAVERSFGIGERVDSVSGFSRENHNSKSVDVRAFAWSNRMQLFRLAEVHE